MRSALLPFVCSLSLWAVIGDAPASASSYDTFLEGWANLQLTQLELGIDCERLGRRRDRVEEDLELSVVDPSYLCLGVLVPLKQAPPGCGRDHDERSPLKVSDQSCSVEVEGLIEVYGDLHASIESDLQTATARGDARGIAELRGTAALLAPETRINVRIRGGKSVPSAVSVHFLGPATTADKLWAAALGKVILRGSTRGVRTGVPDRPLPPLELTLRYDQAPPCLPAQSRAWRAGLQEVVPDLESLSQALSGDCSVEGPVHVTLPAANLRPGAVLWLPDGGIVEVL